MQNFRDFEENLTKIGISVPGLRFWIPGLNPEGNKSRDPGIDSVMYRSRQTWSQETPVFHLSNATYIHRCTSKISKSHYITRLSLTFIPFLWQGLLLVSWIPYMYYVPYTLRLDLKNVAKGNLIQEKFPNMIMIMISIHQSSPRGFFFLEKYQILRHGLPQNREE